MATIKAFSDLEQSRKLAEILPLESADMVYYKYANRPHKNDLDSPTVFKNNNEWYWIDIYDKTPCGKDDIMAWSLAALIDVLPRFIEFKGDKYYLRFMKEYIEYANDEISITGRCLHTTGNNNLVDACVTMIEKLNELKML